VSAAISKIPTELHLHTLSGKKYNYCGPKTNLRKRLNPDKTSRDFSKPVNKVDEICMRHDIAYEEADKGIGTRHDADKTMLNELNELNNKELNWNEFLAKYFTKGVIGVKCKLGLGFDEAQELHKATRHKFKRRRVFVFNVDDIWSADLKDMQSLAKENDGYKYRYLLNVIDLFSKTAYSIPLNSKSSEVIIDAFERLFTNRRPKKLWIDQGSEFISNRFRKFLSDNNIELYHVFNEGKAVVVERFNRTVGEMIQKHLTASNTSRYIYVLQKLNKEYNTRYHSTIKMAPFQASDPQNREQVLRNLYSDIKSVKRRQTPQFKACDRVRIYRYKRTFEKWYKPNWTKEIFIVDEVNKTILITYKIKDLEGESILGSFYKEELSKTKF